MAKNFIPTHVDLMNPLIQSIKVLGGSGTIEEIYAKVAEAEGFSEEQLAVLHNPSRGYETEIEYRLAWARTYLKKYGVLENSSRGIWALTPKGNKLGTVDGKDVRRVVQAQLKKARDDGNEDELDETKVALSWRDELLETIMKMSPAAFERLAQRLLRESGFIQVEVTGRSGDGGIDGKGIMRLGGLLSFHVIFQCKKWKGTVTAKEVRDFRGAMVGRADKGLLITTGTFTKDAIKEATRDGAPAIDMVDGEQFMDKLKELRLGINTRKIEVEEITIEREWFVNI